MPRQVTYTVYRKDDLVVGCLTLDGQAFDPPGVIFVLSEELDHTNQDLLFDFLDRVKEEARRRECGVVMGLHNRPTKRLTRPKL